MQRFIVVGLFFGWIGISTSEPTSRNDASPAPTTGFDIGGGNDNPSYGGDVLGGIPADISDYPFFAIANSNGTPKYCGAVLIHPDILATAAHCFRSWASNTNQACIGTSNLKCSDAIEIISIQQTYVYPDYVRGTALKDIMLVKLASPSRIQPAPWNTNATIPLAKSQATLIGLGRSIYEPVTYPDVIQELAVTIGDPNFCRTLSTLFDPETVICADGIATNSGACQGDSGGPLLSPEGVVLGVVSFGATPCGKAFDGYTRISAYDAWIQQTICGLSAVPPDGCVVNPDWPKVSPWMSPCGRSNCATIFGPGFVQRTHVPLLFFWSFCVDFCVPVFLAELFFDLSWKCGGCSTAADQL